MSPELQAFATGFPATLAHAAVSLLLLALAAGAYGMMSGRGETRRLREGDPAAAIVFGGVLVGLAIPLAASVRASTSLLETIIWGAATLVVQLLAFRLVDVLLWGLPRRAAEGDVPAAVLLAAARLATALVIAAAVCG